MFWRLDLATCWRLTSVAKNVCLAKTGSVFKSFQFFPRTFYYYSLSLSIETHPNTPYHSLQTPFLHLFTSKSPRKRYGFLFPHLISRVLSFIFVNICVGVLIFFRYGFVSFFLGLSFFGLLRYCSYANLFRLINSCIIMCWFS